jgi:hypothetical protein
MMGAEDMKMNIQDKLNLLGWIFVVIGTILFVISFVSEVIRSNPTALVYGMN